MNKYLTTQSGLSHIASSRIAIYVLLTYLLVISSLTTRTFAADGDLDVTFGTAGTVTTNLLDQFDAGYAVAIQPDGKIVVAGAANAQNELFDRVGIVRYLTN